MINCKNSAKLILGTLCAMALAIPTLSSCEHKDLCFDHDVHAPKYDFRVVATYEQEWEINNSDNKVWNSEEEWPDRFGMTYNELRPEVPKGLRMHVFSESGVSDMINMPALGDVVGLRPGNHQLLFYNNDTEYILFDDMYSYASAKATTRTRTRSTYMGNPFKGNASRSEPTVNMPDMLYGNYNEKYTSQRTTEEVVMPVTMHPLVFKYLVRYEFSKGLEYVGLVRGALSGMAAAVYMHNGQTSKEAATLLYDCTLEPWGAQAIVRTFGVPDWPNALYQPTRGQRSYALNLEVRLKNGLIKNFDFDVTDQIEKQPQGGVIIVKGLEISDKDGWQGGSGFDVKIDGWGEFKDIVIPLK